MYYAFNQDTRCKHTHKSFTQYRSPSSSALHLGQSQPRNEVSVIYNFQGWQTYCSKE